MLFTKFYYYPEYIGSSPLDVSKSADPCTVQPLVQKALLTATYLHRNQVRKHTNIPYIVHPVNVLRIVCGLIEDEEVRAAAVLHDTIEDTDYSKEQLKMDFGSRVFDIVMEVSEQKVSDDYQPRPWIDRKQDTLDHLVSLSSDAKFICLADKLDNLEDFSSALSLHGDVVFSWFNAPDNGQGSAGIRKNIGNYYRGILCRLSDSSFCSSKAYLRFAHLVNTIFGPGATNVK